MKKIMDTISGLCVFILLLSNVIYFVDIFYMGVSNSDMYSIEGNSLLLYTIMVTIIIFRYAFKEWKRNILLFIKDNKKQNNKTKVTKFNNKKVA